MTDVVALDERAGAVVADLMAAIPSPHLASPTPCPDWTVGELMVHLVAGNVKYAEIGRGADWWRGAPEVELTEEPSVAYGRSLADLLEAWRRPGALDRDVTLPLGPRPAVEALYIHLAECVVHAWDMSVATGLPVSIDDDIVEASLNQYMSWLPEKRMSGSPFADAAPVPDDASVIERHAAFLGRDVAAWRRLG